LSCAGAFVAPPAKINDTNDNPKTLLRIFIRPPRSWLPALHFFANSPNACFK
jgi:hypothetical protein